VVKAATGGRDARHPTSTAVQQLRLVACRAPRGVPGVLTEFSIAWLDELITSTYNFVGDVAEMSATDLQREAAKLQLLAVIREATAP